MPFFCGLPLGLGLVIVGIALYALSTMKRLARLMVTAGIAIILFSLLAMLLGVRSG